MLLIKALRSRKLSLATISSVVKSIKASSKKNEKTKTLKYNQDLYSRVITIRWSHYIDFKNVLSYELALIPLVLFHPTGEMRKTNKSEILKELEIHSSSYRNVQEICENKVLLVINFMPSLQALSKLALKTFGDLVLCL